MDTFCYLICFVLVFVMLSCALFTALQSPAGKGLTAWLSYRVICYCVFVTFPYGVMVQVWYLIVSIPDLCLLLYFYETKCKKEVKCSTSLPLYRLFQGRFINRIRHDHSCKIFYIFTVNVLEDSIQYTK